MKTLAKQEQDLKDVATTQSHWVEDDWKRNEKELFQVIKNVGLELPNTEATIGNLMQTLD